MSTGRPQPADSLVARRGRGWHSGGERMRIVTGVLSSVCQLNASLLRVIHGGYSQNGLTVLTSCSLQGHRRPFPVPRFKAGHSFTSFLTTANMLTGGRVDCQPLSVRLAPSACLQTASPSLHAPHPHLSTGWGKGTELSCDGRRHAVRERRVVSVKVKQLTLMSWCRWLTVF